ERELLSAAVALAAPATAWRLLSAMVNFLDLHAYSHDAVVLIRTALDRADGDEARAALHLALARTARSLGRTDRAVRAAGTARRLYLRLGDEIRAGSATGQFAEGVRVLGRPAAAYAAYEHAFALLTPHLADRTAVAQTGWCHKELAVLRLYTRGPAEALASFAEGHPFMVRAGDRGGEARTLGGQGLMNLRLGELREGIAQTEAAAVLLAAAGDRVEEIFVRVELAEAYQRDGRPDEALVMIERAVADTRALRLKARITTALCTQGRILAAHGRTETAIGLFEEALGLVGEHQPVSRALVLIELAEAHFARGAHALARDYAEGAGAAERIGVDVPGLRARIDAASGSS
ncbi:MAG TPA: tetratricopeptide repeat protein, partial [Phytomonospora sp.]